VLSIVILNYNVRYFLEICLDSVFKAISNIDAEVIVVDNASSDTSCEMISERFPKVVLIRNKENLGFSKGNNIGVSYAKGEYVCILNPDTIVTISTFKDCLSSLEKDSQLGFVGVRLMDGKGDFLPESKRNFPSPFVALCKMFVPKFSFLAPYYAGHIGERSNAYTDILVGAFMCCKKSFYEAVGGFDERYFMYGEDIDLSYQSLLCGKRNYYIGTTSVLHFKGESSVKDREYRSRFYGAMYLFYEKHYRYAKLFKYGVRLVTSLLMNTGRDKVSENITFEKYYLVSKNENLCFRLKDSLKVEQVMCVQSIDILLEEDSDVNRLVFFDVNYLSYDEIFKCIEVLSVRGCYFRWVSPGSDFYLGSDQNSSLGSVILLP